MKLSDLSLRDYIALEALPAILNWDHGNEWGKQGKDHAVASVRKAFTVADVFIAEREKSR